MKLNVSKINGLLFSFSFFYFAKFKLLNVLLIWIYLIMSVVFIAFSCVLESSPNTHIYQTPHLRSRENWGRTSRQVVKPRGLGSSLRVFFYSPMWWLSHQVLSPLSVCSSDKYCAPGLHESFYDTSHGEEWHGPYLGSNPHAEWPCSGFWFLFSLLVETHAQQGKEDNFLFHDLQAHTFL